MAYEILHGVCVFVRVLWEVFCSNVTDMLSRASLDGPKATRFFRWGIVKIMWSDDSSEKKIFIIRKYRQKNITKWNKY